MSDYNPNQPVNFPLTDGTYATITRLAKLNLEDGYGTYQGRMKKGADKRPWLLSLFVSTTQVQGAQRQPTKATCAAKK